MESAIQTSYGKAFEYSCLKVLELEISKFRSVTIISNSSLLSAETAWKNTPEEVKQSMKLAAGAGANTLFKLEPKIFEDGNDTLELSLQPDSAGEEGDVRDILIIRRDIKWEIGVSVKHNHMAAKHSRLSPSIDFGQEWFGISCSATYFQDIGPIFKYLESARTAGKKWSEITDKTEIIYVPLLLAFKNELERINAANPGVVPQRLLEYLLGRKDFYKLIANSARRTTVMQCVNFQGTLNKPASTRPPELRTGTTRLPTRIYHFDFKESSDGKSKTTLDLVMDQGWAVSFRIHSASTVVENSLKFDIQIPGAPTTLFVHHQQWE